MKKYFKKIGLGLLLIFIAIQFIPTTKNESTETLKSDFVEVFNPPKNIATKLKTACYDCHSNNTAYPWYNKIQPVAWFLEHHIEEAKEELNFSEFGNYSKRKQKSKLKSIKNEIKDAEMPLKSYLIMHKNATFSKAEQKEFIAYFNKIRE